MFKFLKDHPFAVEAFFERSTVFTYAVAKDEAERLIPECLTLDLLDDRWAFIAVAMVQTRGLRPAGFPRVFGSDFFLIGYRVFVRYIDSSGKPMRGLYILRSQTNKARMQFLGNIFTHYNYSTTDIEQDEEGGTISFTSEHSDFRARFIETDENASLPAGSPFASWKEARKYAGPLPFTFTYEPATSKVVIIEGVRKDWKPMPVSVTDDHFSFLTKLNFTRHRLANAFTIRNVPYLWKRGRIDFWNGVK